MPEQDNSNFDDSSAGASSLPSTRNLLKPISPLRKPLSLSRKILFSAVTTGVFLLVLEASLFVGGIQPLHLTTDPFVGFRHGTPLFIRDGDVYRTNPAKLMYFNDQSFPVAKGRNTCRIFCLGGSTTFGHPYHDGTSFVGWLRARLQDAEPDRDWQVINCGGISYASYRICRLMQELVEFEPDMFIFYEGHNEFLEERTYGDFKQRGAVASFADQFVARTRIGTAMASILKRNGRPKSKFVLSSEVDTILEHSVGPEKYHRDPQWREAVVRHFQESLDRACGIAKAAGAKMLIVKPAANLRDFSPFKSESGPVDPATSGNWRRLIGSAKSARQAGQLADATRDFVSAADLDRRHAMTQWEAGDCLLRTGHATEAVTYFRRAVDEDVCPLRAVSEILTAIETVAHERRVPLIDFPKLVGDAVERTAGHRIPGDESFLDHVHPTIENHRRLGWALYDELVNLGVVRSLRSSEDMIERITVQVMKDVDAKKQAIALVQVAQVLSWGGKNAESMKILERAEATHPGLADVMYYRGRLFEKTGNVEEAFRCYTEAVSRNPEDFFALSRLAFGHLKRNDPGTALEFFQRAIRSTPDAAPTSFKYSLHIGLGNTYGVLDRPGEAAIEYRRANQISPGSLEAIQGLQAVEAAKMNGPSIQER